MTEIGYYSILISLFLSAYSGLASVVGSKTRRGDLIASAENSAVAVFGFLSYGGFDWGALTAAATVITLPVLVLALIIQRHIVGGLVMGGIKG